MFKIKINENLLIYKIYKNIKNYIKKENITISYSGGIDSNGILINIIKLIGNNISIIHINHKLNKTDKNFENFCKNISIKYNIKYLTSKIKNNKNYIKKFGTESFLRTKRYKKIFYINNKKFFKNIIFGNQKNDYQETKLLKLIKKSKKNLNLLNKKKFQKLKKIKPFKKIKKIFIKKNLIKENLKWIEDKSNLKTKFLRNKIRIKLLPIIKNCLEFNKLIK